MKAKAEGNIFQHKDMAEEIRLAPKKENVSKIAPRNDFDFDAKKKEEPVKKKKDQGFGGFSAGFLNSGPK